MGGGEFWTPIKEHTSNATSCKSQSPAIAQLIHTGRVYRECVKKKTHRHTHTYTYTHVHTPDASHASSLRAKLASLQLTGNNLSFGFQLPGQTFKLQLLERERERGEGVVSKQSVYLFTVSFTVVLNIILAPSSLTHFLLL